MKGSPIQYYMHTTFAAKQPRNHFLVKRCKESQLLGKFQQTINFHLILIYKVKLP